MAGLSTGVRSTQKKPTFQIRPLSCDRTSSVASGLLGEMLIIRISITQLSFAVAILGCALVVPIQTSAAQTDNQLQRSIEDALHEDRALENLEVFVEVDQVTLTGEVRTFWEKNEALRRAFGVKGVNTVISEIDLPIADNQENLAEEVIKAIQDYPHYRVWDHIDGGLNNGVVTLSGRVTPERDKTGELFERIAKVRGVQDVQIHIDVLPTNRQDDELRRSIARRVFRSEHFERFGSMNNPPFHIVVHHRNVTLVGYVQSEIERIEMERIVGQTQGVMQVENQLQTLR